MSSNVEDNENKANDNTQVSELPYQTGTASSSPKAKNGLPVF